MKLDSKYLLLVFVSLLFVFNACRDDRVYENYIEIPNQEWYKDHVAKFEVEITDSIQLHNIYVNIRNTGKYPFSNLWLFMKQTNPEGQVIEDKFECHLASETGEWFGSGFGDIFDLQLLYKPSVVFTKPGTYLFEITQGMRAEHLPGIVNIGLRLEKTELLQKKE